MAGRIPIRVSGKSMTPVGVVWIMSVSGGAVDHAWHEFYFGRFWPTNAC